MSQMTEMWAALGRLKERKEAELRRLMEDPDRLQLAETLMDEVWQDLTFLCNYQTAVTRSGQIESMRALEERLKSLLSASYQRLVGRPYQPEICRQINHRAERS